MLRPIPTVSHLVPRYWTDLVTSQVLVPNERKLQVTSPSGHEGLGWMSETVDSDFGLEWKAPNSKQQGFLVRFYFLFLPHCFHLKGILPRNLAENIHLQGWAIPWGCGYTRECAVQSFCQPNIFIQNLRKVYFGSTPHPGFQWQMKV